MALAARAADRVVGHVPAAYHSLVRSPDPGLALVALVLAAAACASPAPPPAATPTPSPAPAAASAGGPATGLATEDDPSAAETDTEGVEVALPKLGRVAAREVGAAGIVTEVDRELSAMRATSYVHHTVIDESRGEFDYDCSGFAGYALALSAPQAFAELQQATVERPLAKHFEAFFAGLPPGAGRGHWASVARVQDLHPGDVVAWLRPVDVVSKNSGHVMFVRGPVVPYQGRSDAFVVPVVDSTHAPHGKSDPRKAAGISGLGTGNMVLLTDATGHPTGYKWSTWAKSIERTTTVALGRVVR